MTAKVTWVKFDVEPWVRFDAVMEHLDIGSTATLYRYIAAGMPSIKVGKSRRFRLSEIDAWLVAQSAAAAEPAAQAG